MPSFEIKADIFTRLSVFDSPKGSSNTFKTHKNISLYFKRRYLIIYNYYSNYTWLKIGEKITVIDEKIFRVYEAFDHKNSSHADLRTSHAQLSEKGSQYKEEESENKILS